MELTKRFLLCQFIIFLFLSLINYFIEFSYSTLILIFVSFLFSSICSILFYRVNILSSIERAIDFSEKISRGEFKNRISNNGTSKVSELLKSLNSLAYELEKRNIGIEEQIEGLIRMTSELEKENLNLKRELEKMQFDLSLAHLIQQQLLPKNYPKIQGINISVANFPIGQVGGDCFDFFGDKDQKLGVFLGDVSGKGVSAALVVSMVLTLLRQFVIVDYRPSEILQKLNDTLYTYFGMEHSTYLTSLFLLIDSINRRMTYAIGGHNPPLLLRGNDIISLESEGFSVGMFSNVNFEEKEIEVKGDDKIIIYTDGVIESKNETGEHFGYGNLMKVIKENSQANAFQLTHIIVDAVSRFAGNSPRTDDLTVIVISVS